MEANNFKKEILTDFIQMSVLFVCSVYVVYFTNPLIRDLFFIIPLVLAFISKKDYFWFAFYFILISSPASFFVNRTQDALYRLPFYSITAGFSFSPMDIFLFIVIFKAFRTKVKVKFLLNKPLEFFFFYILIISIPISFMLGTELKPFINTLRSFFYYSLLFSFLRLIKNKEELLKFGYLMIPYTILIIIDQFYVINQNSNLISLFDPSRIGVFVRNSISREVRAVVQGVLIVFYCLIFGFQIANSRKYEIFPGFSSVVIFMAIGSFILSATRSWITIGIVSLIGYIIMSSKGLKFAFKTFSVGGLLIIAMLSSGIIQIEFLENIFQRYAVIGNVATTGSLRSADTFSGRIDEDIPRVMKGVNESPILGVGLSKYLKTYYSSDVGFMNTLLIYGFIGLPVFIFFLFRYIYLLNLFRKEKRYSILEKDVFISLIIGFAGMLTGYFFTWDFFSFFPEKVFFVSIVFATGDLILDLHEPHPENVEEK